MKKLLAIILVICMLSSAVYILPMSVSAEDITSGTCGDNLSWNYDVDTATLTITGTGSMYDYSSYGAPWNLLRDDIISIKVGEDVSSIGKNAFYSCVNLETVDFNDSIVEIRENAFSYCISLKEITIPNSVGRIGKNAFTYCSCLEIIYYNSEKCEDIYDIDYSPFQAAGTDGDGITVIVGKDVKTMPRYLFAWDSFHSSPKIVEVYFEEDSACTMLGEYLFNSCNSLKIITLPSTITSIGHYAFYGCSNLQDIYYRGTSSQFFYIKLNNHLSSYGNMALIGATIHYFCDIYGHDYFYSLCQVCGEREDVADIDSDGDVTMADVVVFRKCMSGSINIDIDKKQADINKDGAIDSKDFLALRRIVSFWN